MKVYHIKTFPITEQMYLSIVEDWPRQDSVSFNKRFEYVEDEETYNKIKADDTFWGKFKIFVKGDITYILGQD